MGSFAKVGIILLVLIPTCARADETYLLSPGLGGPGTLDGIGGLGAIGGTGGLGGIGDLGPIGGTGAFGGPVFVNKDDTDILLTNSGVGLDGLGGAGLAGLGGGGLGGIVDLGAGFGTGGVGVGGSGNIQTVVVGMDRGFGVQPSVVRPMVPGRLQFLGGRPPRPYPKRRCKTRFDLYKTRFMKRLF